MPLRFLALFLYKPIDLIISSMSFKAASSMNLNSGYLLNNGFKEELYSDKKCIYEKGNYQVILIEEFDYLIVIMVI